MDENGNVKKHRERHSCATCRICSNCFKIMSKIISFFFYSRHGAFSFPVQNSCGPFLDVVGWMLERRWCVSAARLITSAIRFKHTLPMQLGETTGEQREQMRADRKRQYLERCWQNIKTLTSKRYRYDIEPRDGILTDSSSKYRGPVL